MFELPTILLSLERLQLQICQWSSGIINSALPHNPLEGSNSLYLHTWRILWPHNVQNKEREYLLESMIQVTFFFCSFKPPCIIHYCQDLPVEFKSSLQSRTLLLSRNYSLVAQVHNQNLFRWIETQIIELFLPRSDSISNFAHFVKRTDESPDYNWPELPIPPHCTNFWGFSIRVSIY